MEITTDASTHNARFAKASLVSSILALSVSLLPRPAAAQDHLRTLDPGTTIPIRVSQAVDVNHQDNRIYTGIVDQDVRADNGRIAVPRGSAAELSVRAARDGDLVLDLESIVANGQRYAIRAEPNRVESHDLIGSIVGTLSGGAVRGRSVRIPRDSVISFRLDRRLDVGVPDRGYDRDGFHYHGDRDRDYRDNRDNRDNRNDGR